MIYVPDDDIAACENCMFSIHAPPMVTGRLWQKKKSRALVFCRRYPRRDGHYAVQFADDWCGEWDDGLSDDGEREDIPTLRLVDDVAA